MELMKNYSMGESKEQLASCLFQTLADVFTMYFMAHSYHWNVKGPEFTQFHDFFGEVYGELHGSVDPLAESIRVLGFNSPMTVLDVANLTMVAHTTPSCNPMAMTSSLYDANNLCIEAFYRTFECANTCNEQGIVNFIADRIMYHEKLRWMLGTILGKDQGGMAPNMPGKFKAAQYIAAEVTPSVTVQHVGYCEMCSDGVCTCPVGACMCDDSCPCTTCARSRVIVVAAGSRPAPKKDRIYGSKKNKPGSATAKGARTIEFSEKTETALRNKMQEHNEKAPAGRKATMRQLKAVYRRGAGAYSSSHRPGKTRDQWAMARVNAYLRLLRTGRPENKNYVQDNDLLPSQHPKASLTASADPCADELTIELKSWGEYNTSEDAILALAEYSGYGYELIPALRSAWKRAVEQNENPFDRAYELAILQDKSKDSDLLPKVD